MAPSVASPDVLYWSDITETTVNREKLRLLCHHEKALRREGYVTSPLTERKLLAKLRCQNCQSKPTSIYLVASLNTHYCTPEHIKPRQSNAPPTASRYSKPDNVNDGNNPNPAPVNSERHICVFHPGRVIQLVSRLFRANYS